MEQLSYHQDIGHSAARAKGFPGPFPAYRPHRHAPLLLLLVPAFLFRSLFSFARFVATRLKGEGGNGIHRDRRALLSQAFEGGAHAVMSK